MDEEVDANSTRPDLAAPAADGDRSRYDGNKRLGQIEDDIARTRVRLGAAIEAFVHELVPRRLIDQSAAAVRDSLEPRADWFGGQAHAYAVPLALIAAGLGWLFVLRDRYWRDRLAVSPGAGAAENGEALAPAPISAEVADPPGPVPAVDEQHRRRTQ